MMIELLGTRIVAPYIGSSLYVWTALIGVMLGGLSIGYWIGGIVADKQANYLILGHVLATGSMLTFLIKLLERLVLPTVAYSTSDIRISSLAISILLFATPSIVLGMVLPIVTKLRLTTLTTSGTTVGLLYAVSTIGSIAGTILTGFVFIPELGHAATLNLAAGLLIGSSVVAYGINHSVSTMSVLLLVMSFLSGYVTVSLNRSNAGIEIDTPYSRVHIVDRPDVYTNRPVRYLTTDRFGGHSAIYLDRNDDLAIPYMRFFRLASYFVPNIRRGLMIGGAGFSYPPDFLKRNQQAILDVAEIDPGMITIAKQYFGLRDDPRMRIITQDGRVFVAHNNTQYDVMFLDAFLRPMEVPYHLITQEAFVTYKNHLTDSGCFIINVIGAFSGEKRMMVHSIAKTMQQVFPQVYAFPVQSMSEGELVQNIILVGLVSNTIPSFATSDPELSSYLHHRISLPIEQAISILTDDKAPVEQYAMKLLIK